MQERRRLLMDADVGILAEDGRLRAAQRRLEQAVVARDT